MICGQPMGLKATIQQNMLRSETEEESASSNNNALEIEAAQALENASDASDPMEKLLLTEECPIRMCLARFNMLGQRQNCHIIDQYTFIDQEKRDSSFLELTKKFREELLVIDREQISDFLDKIEKDHSGLLSKAKAVCERVGNSRLFSGCRRCNMTMNSPNIHINVLYRASFLTHDKDIPLLEKNTQQSIKVKKLIQQITFFFNYDAVTKQWSVKEEYDLMKDVNIWRCISAIASWGLTGKYRFLWIAIFHSSYYLYMTNTLYGTMSFEDWHIFIFRKVYMREDKQRNWKGNTWFGLKMEESKLIFDLSKKRGLEWYSIISERMQSFNITLTEFQEKIDVMKIYAYREMMLKYIKDEKMLIWFMVNKTAASKNIEKGITEMLRFFKFNIQSVQHPRNLTDYCNRFEKELARDYRNLNARGYFTNAQSSENTFV